MGIFIAGGVEASDLSTLYGRRLTPQHWPYLEPQDFLFWGLSQTAKDHQNKTVAGQGDGLGSLVGHYLYDFYYRIWIVPDTMRLRNPRPLVDIPIHIWNAYPEPYAGNVLTDLNMANGDGIQWNQGTPSLYDRLEYREIAFQLLPSAPLKVEAIVDFVFEVGHGLFFLTVDRASIISMIPDTPMNETWEFLTDVFVTQDGSEQRVALRAAPRRILDEHITILNSEEWRTQWKRLFGDINSQLMFPFWQYNAIIKEAIPSGTTVLPFNPVTTDLRIGEYVMVKGRNGFFMALVQDLDDNGCTIDTPTDQAFEKGAVVCPALPCRIDNRTSLAMRSLDNGRMTVKAYTLEPRAVHRRPGATVEPIQFDGYPVLDRRPLANRDVDYSFDGGGQVLDYETGVVEIKSTWDWPQVEGARQFLVNRIKDPNEMDFWRAFTATVHGRRKPFLVPSFREDLVLAEMPTSGAGTYLLKGTEYIDMYFQHEGYSRIWVETAGGPIMKKVSAVKATIEGNTEITFDVPVISGAEYASVRKISFLTLCRLASDEIRLEHHQLHTLLELVLRSVRA